MDLHLSREQEMLRKMYRDFAENEVKPLAEWVDENEAFPEETVKKMAKLGMMGIYFPKEYGGAGADVLSYVMAVEEMSKVCGTTGVIISAHTSLCCAPIFENGTEEQKKYYLPKLCSGEWIGAFGLTEPGAGTDAQGQQTTAVLDEKGENWISSPSPACPPTSAAARRRRSPPSSWSAPIPASPWASTRRRWVLRAPPPAS